MSRALRPLVEGVAPPPSPEEACSRFLDLPFLLFLDSASAGHDRGRFSFLAADPHMVVRSKGPVTSVWKRGSRVWRAAPGGALRTVELVLNGLAAEKVAGLPPFQGGAAGYLGYEYGGRLERLPPPPCDTLALPDMVIGIYDWVLAWDHVTNQTWIISTGIPETGPRREAAARDRLRMVEARLSGPTRSPGEAPHRRRRSSVESFPVPDVSGGGALGLRSSFSREGYCEAVGRVREYILAGDIFQANLSQRFEIPQDRSPFAAYRRLRQRNPAAFSAYFVTGECAVLSASPERFLSLDYAGRVEACPIKGTRPRGQTAEEDEALSSALLASEKDRAENVMIADLLRNDLSRVCRPGTVRATALLELESHPTVHHLVSTIVGELDPQFTALHLVRATFPGGSITGAPKVRAMEIIAELEPTARGVYCGSIGYLSFTGEMDLNIAIRTGVRVGDTFYFQAGGGIVADSEPDAEYRETLDKARGLIDACRGAPVPIELAR
ncbi:MAG: aminodeoxychorismate synthase component I [Gemmatimonadales bacterium]|nr:aminodeoxychorismate synthase component I [Gemmatimonadales bacterium]